MIFVTVGSLLPFERLIRAVDMLAAARSDLSFFAQIGDTPYQPAHMPFERMLDRGAFKDAVGRTSLMVAHAGMGSIITAMEYGIPIIIVPRRLEFSEHNTDHQVATAQWLGQRDGIFVCEDEATLGSMIDRVLTTHTGGQRLTGVAPAPFTDRIREWIFSRS